MSQARTDATDWAIGDDVGKYHILQRLAVGGMAEIYLARAEGIMGFEKHVVLKRILPENAQNMRLIGMFLDEARIAATLHHHNIGQVFDVHQEDGTYFIAMEYLHGRDTRDVVRSALAAWNEVPLEHTIAIVSAVAAGLHYAHEMRGPDGEPLGIVHRDATPSNIVVTYDGGVKLVDFGVARANSRSVETREGGELKGKISYMSPEQCVGAAIDRRSDIFTLGIVLFEFTTLRRLFRHSAGDSDYVVMDRIVKGTVPRPTELVPGYAPELEDIVLRALQTRPDDRYATAAAMLEDLEAFARQERLATSTGSLSRMMTELYGTPPEPWRELDDDITETEDATPITLGWMGARDEPSSELLLPAAETVMHAGVDAPSESDDEDEEMATLEMASPPAAVRELAARPPMALRAPELPMLERPRVAPPMTPAPVAATTDPVPRVHPADLSPRSNRAPLIAAFAVAAVALAGWWIWRGQTRDAPAPTEAAQPAKTPAPPSQVITTPLPATTPAATPAATPDAAPPAIAVEPPADRPKAAPRKQKRPRRPATKPRKKPAADKTWEVDSPLMPSRAKP